MTKTVNATAITMEQNSSTDEDDMTLVVHRRHRSKRLRLSVSSAADPVLISSHKTCQQCRTSVPLKYMMEWGRQNICRECNQRNFWEKLTPAHRWYYQQRRQAKCFKCGFLGATEPRCINNVLSDGYHRRPEKRLLRLAKQNNMIDLKREIRNGVWICVCCSRESRFQQFLDMKVSMDQWPQWKSSSVPSNFDQKLYCEQSTLLKDMQIKIGQCRDCRKTVTSENWMCFDWDHVNPASKSFTIGIKIGCIPTKVLLSEVDKCELRCVNCHCIRTQKEHHGEIRRFGGHSNIQFFVQSQPVEDPCVIRELL